MLRSGTNEQEWNGVWIVGLLSKELKEDLINMSRNSDLVMTIELGLEEMVVNIMCACAPQVGCRLYRMKNKRFGNMDQELSATLDGEGVIVGGYLHNGADNVP